MSHSKDQLHIAYLTGEYPAVSHTFILREIQALRDRGLEITTCSIRQTDKTHHRGQAEKNAVTTTYYVLAAAKNPWNLILSFLGALASPGRFFSAIALAWRIRPPGMQAGLYQIFYFVEAAILTRFLKQRRVDHLHNHFGNSSCTVAMLTSELSGIPFSYTMHGPAIFFEPRHWRIDEKIARSRFVACISHYCRSQGMIFSDPKHWHKLGIVHCGISPKLYGNNATKKVGKRVLFVGRLAAVKGVPILLEAFEKVLQKHPDALLTLVGDGPERAAIEKIAKGLGNSVRFAGYLSQQEVAQELDATDVFTLPSFAEGVPVVLMEAMASRVPVIATRIAGIPELVEDSVSGKIVPPGNVDALAAALIELLESPDKRAAMGKAGRSKVLAEYDIEHAAKTLASLFQYSTENRPYS